MTNRNDGLEDWEYQEKMLAENDRGREPEWRPQRSFGHYWAETGPYFTWVLNMVNFLDFHAQNVYRIRLQEIKIGPWEGFEKKAFFSLFLMRKRLSGGQKWFLRPYFSLIRGMFVFRSGLRFSFRTPRVPILRVRKRSQMPFSQNPLMAQFWSLGI